MSKSKQTDGRFNPGRRKLLTGIAASAAGAAVLSDCGESVGVATNTGPVPSTTLPNPQDSGINHIVVVMMENRSFDHYLGWVPGAMGKQAGLSFTDTSGKTYLTHPLAPNYQNCQASDPDHSYAGGRKEINGGKMDGFLMPQPVGDQFPIGYYMAADLPFHAAAVANWTICDRYFCSILSATFPNRVYMHAGQTDRNDNTLTMSTLPTVWDRLAAVGRTGRYYYSDEPVTAIWGSKYLDISFPYATFKLDAAAGRLADVTYIDPAFVGEGNGISRDDHPLADIRNGQAFLDDIYETLRTSPQWANTLLVINYDEWGGFFDHVEPPFAPVSGEEFKATGNDGRLGVRVPVVIAGPRAKRGHIENLQFDHCSVLNMIAWRFGLAPLGVRGNTSYNLAYALDFENPPNTEAPAFSVPTGPFGTACGLPTVLGAGVSTLDLSPAQRRLAEHLLDWEGLRTMARRYGFRPG